MVVGDDFGRRQAQEHIHPVHLVAGSGIENIYSALQELRGEIAQPLSAKEVFAAAGTSATAADTVEVFFRILGQVAGDVALTMGAADGVYIAGGIAKRYPEMLDSGPFRSAFESKGRHRDIMETIPTFLITHEQPALLGAAYCVMALTSSIDSS